MLEKRRLEKQSLARARGISGHLDVIRVNVGFDRISDVFDLDVGKLSGAHPTLNVLAKRLLTLHNLTFMERLMSRLREAIEAGGYAAEAERVLSGRAAR